VDGTIVWKLSGKPFHGLEETRLNVTELCALYFSRSVLGTLGGAPFHDETERAFMKLEHALPAASPRFLDRFPLMLKTKALARSTRPSVGGAFSCSTIPSRRERRRSTRSIRSVSPTRTVASV
jgi:hypothetical protein